MGEEGCEVVKSSLLVYMSLKAGLVDFSCLWQLLLRQFAFARRGGA